MRKITQAKRSATKLCEAYTKFNIKKKRRAIMHSVFIVCFLRKEPQVFLKNSTDDIGNPEESRNGRNQLQNTSNDVSTKNTSDCTKKPAGERYDSKH